MTFDLLDDEREHLAVVEAEDELLLDGEDLFLELVEEVERHLVRVVRLRRRAANVQLLQGRVESDNATHRLDTETTDHTYNNAQ